MLLGGVSVDEGLVRKLAAILDKPLENKLTQALLFRARIVALTIGSRPASEVAFDQDRGRVGGAASPPD
jgi:hypothetical protein